MNALQSLEMLVTIIPAFRQKIA